MATKIETPTAEILPMSDVYLLDNYRQSFNPFRLAALARSIKGVGLIKPILTLEDDEEKFGTVAGQRRYLASKMINAQTIKSMVYQNLTDGQILRIQLAENSQEKIALDECAHSYWEMYKASLAKKLGGRVRDLDQFETYWNIPSGISSQYSMKQFCRDVGKQHGYMIRAFHYQGLHSTYKRWLAEDRIKFSAAVELGRVTDKNDQMRFSRLFTDNEEFKYIGNDGVERVLTKKGRSARGNASKVREAVDGYLKQKISFSLTTTESRKGSASLETRLSRQLQKAASFFEAYKELCAELPWIYRDVSADHETEHFIGSVDRHLPRLEKLLAGSEQYQQVLSAPKKKSLRELILGEELDSVLKNGGNGKNDTLLKKDRFNVTQLQSGRIYPDVNQPRRRYGEMTLENLTESVKAVGILEPILVVPIKNYRGKHQTYRIVAGHRRTRAAKAAGLKRIPAIIAKGLTEEDIRLLQHEEDIFEEVSKAERASGLYNTKRLKEAALGREISIAEFARMLPGFGIGEVGNALKFESLDDRIKSLESKGLLKYSVAVRLAGIDDIDDRYTLAVRAVLGDWGAKDIDDMLKRSEDDTRDYSHLRENEQVRSFFDNIQAMEQPGLRMALADDVKNYIGGFASAVGDLVRRQEMLDLDDKKLLEAYVHARRAFDEFKRRNPKKRTRSKKLKTG